MAGVVIASTLASSCDSRSVLGNVDLLVHDIPVACDTQTGQCETPADLQPQHVGVQAFVSATASRHAPDGLYIYFEFSRPGGVVAHVELDFSTRSAVGAVLSYREYVADRMVFGATSVQGQIEVADPSCSCGDGRLELLFTDPGPDGQTGTPDDRVRRLSRLRYGWDAAGFCRTAHLLDLPEGVQVRTLHDCPSSGSSGTATNTESEGAVGCSAEDDGYDDDTGCGGDTGDDGDYDSGDTGCEGDGSDSDSYDSSGCEGSDSGGSDSYDSSGCEGDSSSDASCEGDAYASVAPRGRGPHRRQSAARTMLPPFLLLGLWLRVLRRRRR